MSKTIGDGNLQENVSDLAKVARAFYLASTAGRGLSPNEILAELPRMRVLLDIVEMKAREKQAEDYEASRLTMGYYPAQDLVSLEKFYQPQDRETTVHISAALAGGAS